MKFNPLSNATRTDFSTSSKVTLRNSAPSDEAPKLRIGTCRPVLPRGRVCISDNQQSLMNARERNETICHSKPLPCRAQALGYTNNSRGENAHQRNFS